MTSAKRILIADDDEDLAEALACRCRMSGLIVDTANDGMTALQKLDSFQPDLMIMDVNMPSGNGLGICEMMGRDPFSAVIPVIVLTGRQDIETRSRCQILHAQYVAKGPNVWPQLESLIRHRLGLSAAQPAAVKKAADGANHAFRADPQHSITLRLHDRPRTESGQLGSMSELLAQGEQLSEEDRIQERFIDAVFTAFGGRAAESDARLEQVQAANSVSRPRVLCIDDDGDLLNSLRLRLEQHGIETNQASGATEGYLQAFLSETQAIILDYEMPHGNGDYVLRRLKENRVFSGICG